MAESVESYSERRFPELLHMLHWDLFSQMEIREIEIFWKDHLYRIEQGIERKEDFMTFINHHLDLLSIISVRRQCLNFYDKKELIEYNIMKRIDRLYVRHVLSLFPEDLQLWHSYIEFCRRVRFHSSASFELHNMIVFHGGKAETWKFAADWEIEIENLDKARKWLKRGILCHSESSVLHLENIKLELDLAKTGLNEVSKMKNEKDESIEIMNFMSAEIAYGNAAKAITDFNFYANVWELIANYPAANNLRCTILNDIITKFPMNEAAWNLIAHPHMEGANQDEPASFIDAQTDEGNINLLEELSTSHGEEGNINQLEEPSPSHVEEAYRNLLEEPSTSHEEEGNINLLEESSTSHGAEENINLPEKPSTLHVEVMA